MALFGGNDQLQITIKAKDEASRELDKARLSVGRLAGGVALGTVAIQGLQAGFRFISNTITDSINEAEQYNQAVGQMNAVLKSTGSAAGLTRRELVDMASALSEVTLYQDDQVLSAQNMLLTFTNITKNVFPQATQTVLDMSAALGTDLKSSAIQLGKALNDPINGISALQRVGVTFTESQKEQIETLVKSGHTIEAQNRILQELQKEFGGSAKSAYDSASSIVKLEKNVTDLKQGIGQGLTPALNNLFSAFEKVTTGMGHTIDVGKVTFKTFSAIGEFAANTAAGIHYLAAGIAGLPAAVNNTLSSIMGPVSGETDQFWKDYGDSVAEGLDTTTNFAMTLREENRKVLNSWGQVSDAATVVGNVGPAAYEATADEAAKAKKAIDDTKRAIIDTGLELGKFQDQLSGESQDLGTAFVEQKQKINDLQKELSEERAKPATDQDKDRIKVLRDQIGTEQLALSRNKDVAKQIPDEIKEAKRRSGLTDFERNVEDINRRIQGTTGDFAQYIAFNFPGSTVVGDKGIQDLIMQTIKQLNRNATLAGVAGR
jgi:phage-related minor tail protein